MLNEATNMSPLDCYCGQGKMMRYCIGSYAKNPVRHYYKCLVGEKHPKDFIWCDEFHHLKSSTVHLPMKYPHVRSCLSNRSLHSNESHNSQVRLRSSFLNEKVSGHESSMTESNVHMGFVARNFHTNHVVWYLVSFVIIRSNITSYSRYCIALSLCKCI